MRKSWIILTAVLGSASFADFASAQQAPVQGDPAPAAPAYQGTATMPSTTMPGTSATQAIGVPSERPDGRGAPPSGGTEPQRGGGANLSTGSQIRPGAPGGSGTSGSTN